MKRITIPTKITVDQLLEFSFVLFFCNPFIYRALASILSNVGLQEIARMLSLIIVYTPVLVILLIKPKKLPWEFLLFAIILVLAFLLTYLIHPEYEYWYTRNPYGVWDYVLRPDNGLYAYLFIRMVNDPKKIRDGLKKSAWLMYIYYMILLLEALRVGYWVQWDKRGEVVHLSYNLTFGYDVLLFMLIFLHEALTNKKTTDYIMAAVGFGMIFLGGSRGPILCVLIYIALFYFNKIQNAKLSKKLMMIAGIAVCALLIYALYDVIILWIATIMSKFGFSSRTLLMLLKGNITSDNGRTPIYTAAIQMIKDNPFGYGPMGSRHVLYALNDVGHPHQIFLEILIDFGVIAGAILSVFLVFNCGKLLIFNRNAEWKAIFTVFFARSCQLLLSGTFWHIMPFWACLGIGVSATLYEKRQHGRYNRINGI